MQSISLTNNFQKVTPVGTGICIAQGHGAQIYLGDTVPSAGDPCITLTDNYPLPVDVDKFTEIHVKGSGVFRFAG